MEWVKNPRHQARSESLFIKNDFDKTYDIVGWPFILANLKLVVFGPFFVKTMETIFVESTSSFLIN
jgi:hypothetical protein